jgi:inosine-uridine nucleoside N-ribohydrolase
MRIHLDTDLGSNPDDACALVMLLGWPGVELAGITTTIDPGGRRAACVAHLLALAGREEIPVAAGAGAPLSAHGRAAPAVGDERYWPSSLAPRPSPPNAALDLLAGSIAQGASVVAIGPYTNLAQLELARSGSLRRARVVIMGGWLAPPADGLLPWGPEADWNVQYDARAAEVVAATAGELALATLPVTLKSHLRRADVARLRAAGALGELLARQSIAHALDSKKASLGRLCAGLPDDLLNFHHDPAACAVALGWPGATVAQMRLATLLEDGVLRFRVEQGGRTTGVLTDLDGRAFGEAWLAAVEAAAASRASPRRAARRRAGSRRAP